jgi:hypothetical protein
MKLKKMICQLKKTLLKNKIWKFNKESKKFYICMEVFKEKNQLNNYMSNKNKTCKINKTRL